jgi:hypothetical protein
MSPANDVLSALRDIHLPEAVSLWPPAPGWWVAAGLIVALAVTLRLVQLRRRRSVTRAALRELDGLERDHQETGDAAEYAVRLSALLRRVALARFPRNVVASLHGAFWVDFLSRASAFGFPSEVVEAMERAVFEPPRQDHPPEDTAAWGDAARAWIRRMS